jgi:hypothetical protein
MNDFMTTKEAAEFLRLSIHTLNAWRYREPPQGPAWIEAEGAIRYDRKDLLAWMESRKRNAEPVG